MAADLELLAFLAPAVCDASHYDKCKALEIAKAYRPACLSDDMADQAQVWYAAWLLYGRMQQGEFDLEQSGPVTMRKEGDLQISYGANLTKIDGVLDSGGFYAQWKRLADMCGRGAIIASGRSNRHRFM